MWSINLSFEYALDKFLKANFTYPLINAYLQLHRLFLSNFLLENLFYSLLLFSITSYSSKLIYSSENKIQVLGCLLVRFINTLCRLV